MEVKRAKRLMMSFSDNYILRYNSERIQKTKWMPLIK
jgi:hypothetical protein